MAKFLHEHHFCLFTNFIFSFFLHRNWKLFWIYIFQPKNLLANYEFKKFSFIFKVNSILGFNEYRHKIEFHVVSLKPQHSFLKPSLVSKTMSLFLLVSTWFHWNYFGFKTCFWAKNGYKWGFSIRLRVNIIILTV